MRPAILPVSGSIELCRPSHQHCYTLFTHWHSGYKRPTPEKSMTMMVTLVLPMTAVIVMFAITGATVVVVATIAAIPVATTATVIIIGDDVTQYTTRRRPAHGDPRIALGQ